MTPDERLKEAARRLVISSRTAQGLPPQIEDPAAAADFAQLLRSGLPREEGGRHDKPAA